MIAVIVGRKNSGHCRPIDDHLNQFEDFMSLSVESVWFFDQPTLLLLNLWQNITVSDVSICHSTQ